MCKIVEEYGDQRAAEALKEGIQQGIQQGMQQGIQQAAKLLLADRKYTTEEIAKLLNVPVEAFAK